MLKRDVLYSAWADRGDPGNPPRIPTNSRSKDSGVIDSMPSATRAAKTTSTVSAASFAVIADPPRQSTPTTNRRVDQNGLLTPVNDRRRAFSDRKSTNDDDEGKLDLAAIRSELRPVVTRVGGGSTSADDADALAKSPVLDVSQMDVETADMLAELKRLRSLIIGSSGGVNDGDAESRVRDMLRQLSAKAGQRSSDKSTIERPTPSAEPKSRVAIDANNNPRSRQGDEGQWMSRDRLERVKSWQTSCVDNPSSLEESERQQTGNDDDEKDIENSSIGDSADQQSTTDDEGSYHDDTDVVTPQRQQDATTAEFEYFFGFDAGATKSKG